MFDRNEMHMQRCLSPNALSSSLSENHYFDGGVQKWILIITFERDTNSTMKQDDIFTLVGEM